MSTPTDFTEVPVVDVSGLLGDDPAAHRRVADELGRAARDVGFFYVSGTGLDPALAADLLRVTTAFFALPLEEKMRTYIGRSTNHRGYVPEGEEVFAGGTRDLKEAFDLSAELPADDPDHLAGRMLGPNQWPEVPGFREAVGAWYDAVLALGRALLRGFALALGEPADAFDRFVTKPPSQLRLIHYPYDPTAVDAVGIGAHTDYECFTLLLPTAPGLEVLNGAGEWIDVPPREGTLVVNVGDILETWTNGRFVATTHRVRKVKEERYSFPLFFNVDHETLVAPLPRFVADGEPTRVPLVAGDHLFAQTAQSFTYLRRRLENGELALPEGSLALSSFGQEALQGRTA
ncbi:isopenicillin N synthase family dioxygenase [Geodermatophilus sp. SYSU D00815]